MTLQPAKIIQIDFRSILTIFLIAGLIWLIIELKTLVLLFFLALLSMMALEPSVRKFEKRGLPRAFSALLVIILFVVFIVSLLGLIIPPLITELLNFIDWLKDTAFIQNSYQWPTLPIGWDWKNLLNLTAALKDATSLLNSLQEPFANIFNFATSLFANAFLLLSYLVMTYYLLLDRPHLAKKVAWITPDKAHEKKLEDFLVFWEKQVGGWIRGKLILMILVGLITFFTLSVFKVPYALPLAILAGLLEIVPNLGPTIATIPAVLISAFFQGPIVAVIVLASSIIIQQVESNVLAPRIMSVTAHVNPLIVMLAILAGAHLAGVLGALLAVPIYISVRAWYSFFILHPKKKMVLDSK